MMKKISYISFLLVFTWLINACKEDVALLYEEDPRVYFMKRSTSGTTDSIDYSFAFQEASVKTHTVDLRFRIIGFPKDYDRAIKLVLEDTSTAEEGYHFSIENLFIPANASDGTATLTFQRSDDLKEKTVVAVFHIVENEHFKAGYKDKDWGKLDRLTYKFTLTDKLSKPALWNSLWQNLFGDYSERKIVFLTNALPYSDWNTGVWFPQDQNQLIQKSRIALYEFEQANGPMIDENGNRVIIP